MRRDEVCPHGPYHCGAGRGRQDHPATLTDRQRDDNPKKQISWTSFLQPELLRPQPFFFSAHIIIVRSLKTVLDHLIHVREPDPEDLRQDLLGHLELHGLWLHPRCAMHHSSLLWPD